MRASGSTSSLCASRPQRSPANAPSHLSSLRHIGTIFPTMRLLLRSLRSLNTRSTLSAPTLAPSSLLSLPSSSLASSSSSSARAFSTSPSRSLIGTGSIRRPRQKKHVRVGRGQGQGTGEGKGRGTKGQNARAGPGPHRAFSGGETPVTQQFPKRGFFNLSVHLPSYHPVRTRVRTELDGRWTNASVAKVELSLTAVRGADADSTARVCMLGLHSLHRLALCQKCMGRRGRTLPWWLASSATAPGSERRV